MNATSYCTLAVVLDALHRAPESIEYSKVLLAMVSKNYLLYEIVPQFHHIKFLPP